MVATERDPPMRPLEGEAPAEPLGCGCDGVCIIQSNLWGGAFPLPCHSGQSEESRLDDRMRCFANAQHDKKKRSNPVILSAVKNLFWATRRDASLTLSMTRKRSNFVILSEAKNLVLATRRDASPTLSMTK